MTEKFYIKRTLIADQGKPTERSISEDELGSLKGPLIILGDPGLGKTRLTETLANAQGGLRVAGGTFYRNENISGFAIPKDGTIIIDGLDEIAAASGQSAVDEVLRKLSRLGAPRFVLSCRAADWQGSSDRYKIAADYGIEPTTLLLQPFSTDQAIEFLNSVDGTLDAVEIVSTLEARELGELCGNPLTLTLVAEVAKDGKGLPQTRSDLLVRACEVLVKETNRAHQGSRIAKLTLDQLLDSAGAIFAHLLLSGSTGIADRPRTEIPDGYISKSDLSEIPDAPEVQAVLKTRLFQSAGENLSIPFHKVIAEFLGARWLSKRMSNELSERRVLHALATINGVPSALRGLHAWLAFFSDTIADRCIKTDPYGVLRYGETSNLSVARARKLLMALASLANEDPYFRSEDWGRKAIVGLARPELKTEIVELIKRPDRHIHLSTLVLEALPGSTLTDQIIPELIALICDAKAVYAERINAAEALIKSQSNVDWSTLLETLRADRSEQNKRLILDIASHDSGHHFTDMEIADSILAYQSPKTDQERDAHVSGMDYLLVKNLSAARSAEVLDVISERLFAKKLPRYERVGNELATTVHRLIAKSLNGGVEHGSARLWAWLNSLHGAEGYSSHDREHIQTYLNNHPTLRSEIQKLAFENSRTTGEPWMVVVHDLPAANKALALSLADAVGFVQQIAAKPQVSKFDAELWAAIVRSRQSTTGFPDALMEAAKAGFERHSLLGNQWQELTAQPKRDWQKENDERESLQREKKLRQFEARRAAILPSIDGIRSGQQLGYLNQMANGYLNRYTDLDHDATPLRRLEEWMGAEIAAAALAGFVAALSRPDLPTASQIAESHAESKSWNCEPVITCGILELVRTNRSLNELPTAVVQAALASWWEYPDFNSNKYGETIQPKLEAAVFDSPAAIEEFLINVVEPRIRAKNEHVPFLYRISREERFRDSAAKLGIKWLRENPEAPSSVQWQLLETAIEHGSTTELVVLTGERLNNPTKLSPELRAMWMSAAFLLDFEARRMEIETFCDENRDNLWSLRKVVRPERSMGRQISLEQYELVIVKFSSKWPPTVSPRAGWGDTNEWNADEFIRSCIEAVGSEISEKASIVLDRLVANGQAAPYSDYLKHVRAQQRRKRRDNEFHILSFDETKRMLAGGLPASIDDLKALILDTLEIVQDYTRDGDTDSWEAFWAGDRPKDENTCRHRLLDLLRPRLPIEIALLPETLMPENKRADIVAIYLAEGVPTEIKGQWHPDLWNAAKVQLIEKYARDWRADGRGIYLVLWFGNVPGKQMPKHPDGLAAPTTPSQLREMLLDRLSESERSKINVIVFDVSRPNKR